MHMLDHIWQSIWQLSGGQFGFLVSVFVIFFIGAFVPLGLELLFVFAFSAHPTVTFGLMLMATALGGELLGNVVFYGFCRRFGVPRVVQRMIRRYTGFLCIKGEKALLFNRVAPIVPIAAPFMVTCRWHVRKTIAYIALGFVIKNTILMLMVACFNFAYSKALAQWLSLTALVAIMVISMIVARYQRTTTTVAH